MPVITFTPGDGMKALKMEVGVYPAEVSSIDTSTSGKGNTNFFIELTITEGKYKGKEIRIASSTGTSDDGLLGTIMWFHKSVLLRIDAAIKGEKTITPGNTQLNTDDLLHKPLEIAVGVTTVDGNIINTVTNFFPVGQAAAAGVPF